MEIKLPFKFEQGDLVTCVGLTKDNPEKLVEGRTYAVVGISIVDDGNVVYALKDYFGNLVYTMSEHLELLGHKRVSVVQDGQPLTENDPVNHPNHYTAGGIECIDYLIAKLPKDELIGYCRGNAMKYLSRVGLKDDPIQEYKKAQWYLNKLIEVMSESK